MGYEVFFMFCIRDQNGKFVNQELVFYDKIEKKFIYEPYDTIIGVNLYPSKKEIQKIINKLNKASNQHHLGLTFLFSEIV